MVKRQRKQASIVSSSSDAATLILPGLYLGPCSAASSKPFITGSSISTVLSVGATPSAKVDGVTYHRLSVNDAISSSITKVIETAVDIIDGALKSNKGNGKILVHCLAGISRSATVVVAYLMKRREMSLRAALLHVQRLRPQIHPNSGFLRQLKELEVELTGVSTLDVEELPRREKDRLALFEAEIVNPKSKPEATTSSNPS